MTTPARTAQFRALQATLSSLDAESAASFMDALGITTTNKLKPEELPELEQLMLSAIRAVLIGNNPAGCAIVQVGVGWLAHAAYIEAQQLEAMVSEVKAGNMEYKP